MKKNSSISEEMPVERTDFYGIHNSSEDQEFLLFLIDPENNRIEGLNLKARTYFGQEITEDQGNFFERVVHPEDYPVFQKNLHPCTSAPGKTTEARVRLLTSRGEWESFHFINRRYLREDFGNKQHILSVARQTDSDSAEKESQTGDDSESVLQKTRNKYRTLLDSIDEAFASLEILFDLQERPIDYLFIESNPSFANHSNVKDPDGRTIRELIPGFEDDWLTTCGKVALTGKPTRFHGFSGQVKNTWFDVYAFPIGEDGNKKVGMIFSDITAKKMAEEKLKQVNHYLEQQVQQRTQELKEKSGLLQTIFDTTNLGIVVLKPLYTENGNLEDFQYLRVNKVIAELYKRTDLEGERFLAVNPGAPRFGIFQAFKNSMLTGESDELEIHYDHEDHDSWYQFTVRRQNGLLITTVENISQRKREAQRLKENIRFKKHLTRASPDIILIFNLYDECIQYINRDLSPRPGMSKSEVQGRKLTEILRFIHPREREKAMEFHQKIINGSNDEITETEIRLKGTDKTWEWVNAVGKVFHRNKNGKVYEYMILLRNIDHQKATQQALLRAEKLSIKGEVARTLAHELRNPLASIGMATDILSGSLPEESKKQFQSYLGIIKRSTKVLNNLVTDLLTSSSYAPAVLKKNCLASIIEDTLKLAGDRIYLTGIKLIKEYEGPYPINADDEKLKIALLNIIINASEAITHDQGILRIKIVQDADSYILTLKDNGIGLEKEELEKLFDAFYTKKAEGVGIGLSSVKNILEEHDAKIQVHSEPGKGTQFELSFQSYEILERC